MSDDRSESRVLLIRATKGNDDDSISHQSEIILQKRKCRTKGVFPVSLNSRLRKLLTTFTTKLRELAVCPPVCLVECTPGAQSVVTAATAMALSTTMSHLFLGSTVVTQQNVSWGLDSKHDRVIYSILAASCTMGCVIVSLLMSGNAVKKNTLVFCTTVSSLSIMGGALSPSFTCYILSLALLGLSTGGSHVIGFTLFSESVTKQCNPLNRSIHLLMLSESSYLINLIICLISDLCLPGTSWRWSYILISIPTILSTILLFFLPDSEAARNCSTTAKVDNRPTAAATTDTSPLREDNHPTEAITNTPYILRVPHSGFKIRAANRPRSDTLPSHPTYPDRTPDTNTSPTKEDAPSSPLYDNTTVTMEITEPSSSCNNLLSNRFGETVALLGLGFLVNSLTTMITFTMPIMVDTNFCNLQRILKPGYSQYITLVVVYICFMCGSWVAHLLWNKPRKTTLYILLAVTLVTLIPQIQCLSPGLLTCAIVLTMVAVGGITHVFNVLLVEIYPVSLQGNAIGIVGIGVFLGKLYGPYVDFLIKFGTIQSVYAVFYVLSATVSIILHHARIDDINKVRDIHFDMSYNVDEESVVQS